MNPLNQHQPTRNQPQTGPQGAKSSSLGHQGVADCGTKARPYNHHVWCPRFHRVLDAPYKQKRSNMIYYITSPWFQTCAAVIQDDNLQHCELNNSQWACVDQPQPSSSSHAPEMPRFLKSQSRSSRVGSNPGDRLRAGFNRGSFQIGTTQSWM